MIKVIFCLRRHPSLTPEEFSRYWRNEHAARVLANYGSSSMVRYTQSHRLDDPRLQPVLEARGSVIEPFDGVAECWWNSASDAISAEPTQAEIKAARDTLADEAKFIDLKNSVILFADEYIVFDRT